MTAPEMPRTLSSTVADRVAGRTSAGSATALARNCICLRALATHDSVAPKGDFRKSGRMNDATSAGKMKHPEKRSKQSAPRQLSSFALRSRYEHFIALARAAASEVDRVAMENWYQHAEHYFRAMKEPTA